jgi:hypothetical protein
LIVLVALPICTTITAQNLRSNADGPAVTDTAKDGDKAAITPGNPEETNTPDGSSVSPAASANTGSEDAAAAAAKDAAQNLLASTISVPFQNNSFFNVGPYGRSGTGLLIEPVIPFKLTVDWNLLTRTVIPVIYQPQVSPSQGSDIGLGNVNPQFFLSPARSARSSGVSALSFGYRQRRTKPWESINSVAGQPW